MDPSYGKLPDDILRSVIRWLPMREAVKTSLVSKSWRYLWASSVADIDFDRDNIPGISVPDELDNYEERSQIFARTVDHFLSIHGATKIDTFRIIFPMGDECNKHVDDWVIAAIRKQAKKLILDFDMCQRMCPRIPNRCRFPLHLLDNGKASSQLTHLNLDSCKLEIPDQLCGLASLKILILKHVIVSNVQSLISGCCLLESVTISNCSGVGDIKFGSSLGRLKHLKLEAMCNSVAICCLNLVSIDKIDANNILWNDEQFPLPTTEVIRPCPSLTRFESLQKVHLSTMDLAEQDLINLFSVCPGLERLQLKFCFFPRMPLHRRLKYLEVEEFKLFNHDDPGDTPVEICRGPCLTYVRWHRFQFPGDELMHVKLVNCDGQVFSSSSTSPLRHLHLVNCITPQSNYAPFKYLQELTLTPVRLRDRDIWSLLSHCSHLQRLRLSGGGSRFRHFKIPFSSHPLKYLELKDNKFMDKVDLCSANLVFFELHTTLPVNLRIKQAPKLTRVSLGSWSDNTRDVTIRSIMKLPSLIPRLETLTLFFGPSTSSATGEAILASLPEFKHLKRLVVILDNDCCPPQSYLWMVSLIHSAPELQIFELHIGNFDSNERPKIDRSDDMQKILKPTHNHLKEVKISGFFGNEYEINMAVYLLKYASSLELMTIETNGMEYEGDDTWKIFKGKWADPCIRTRLMKHVSSCTKLVI